jgi:RHS repeat-associated protein
MFQFTPQQINTFQRHANKQARTRLLESLIAEGVAASEQPGSDEICIRDAKGAKSTLRYRADGSIGEWVRPSGKSTSFDYDRSAYLKSISYPGNIRHEFVRNSLGQVESFSISGESKYSFSYRTDQRISKVQFPDSREVGFDWSEDGSLETFTDRCGNKTHYHSTQAGESVTDSLGRKRIYETDQEGKLEALLFPDGTREVYAFDQENNLVEFVQRSGSWVLLQLDDQGSPGLISWQDGNELELKFDDQDRLVAAKAGDFQVNRVYTKSGQVDLEDTIAGPVKYQFDPNGRVVSYTTPFGDTVKYEYDEDGLLKGIQDWDNRRILIDYAENDTPCRFAFPSGVTEEQSISAAPYRASSKLQARSGIISEHTIEADESDRVRSVVDRWGSAAADRLNRRLEYDQEDRLVAEYHASDRRPLANFAYDAVGNMILDNGRSIEFSSMNQPLRRGNRSVVYDSLGNVSQLTTSCGLIDAIYSEDNRLRVLRSNGQDYRYEYDGLCRRIRKTNGKETWLYGWSGSQLLWEEHFPAPKAESIRRDYLYLPNASTPIAFRERGKTYWIQTDFRGAVIAVHDEAGTIVWRGVYESFGACNTPINQVRQPWRLAGQYFDEESGLHYNFARYYCPKNKTYLSLDPRWQEPEATNYSYARNDPWNRADPLGMLPTLVAGIVAGAIVGAAISAYTAEPGERAGAALKGAAMGAGTAAIAGLAALSLPATGAFAATALGGLAMIGAVEGAAGSLLENPTCLPCSAKAAAAGALLGVAMPFVGGLLSQKVLKHFKGRELQKVLTPKKASRIAGISSGASYKLQKLVNKYDIIIQMRPTNPYALKLLNAGTHNPKPMGLKPKTMNNADLALFPKGRKAKPGECVIFEPVEPPRNASKELKERYKQRQKEWKDNQDIVKGTNELWELDANGTVRCKKTKKAFAGDNDIFSVKDAKTGKELDLDAPENHKIRDALYSHPVSAQHPQHRDPKWNPKDAQTKKIKKDIERKHSKPTLFDSKGKEPLVEYSKDSPPREVWSSS